MFCPQCAQQQVSETVRYCSRCGFPLEGVSAVVASGGQLPMRYLQSASRELSPRSKGVRQGALLMLSTFLIVPIVAILTVSINAAPHIFVPIAAIGCFVGGLLRMRQSIRGNLRLMRRRRQRNLRVTGRSPQHKPHSTPLRRGSRDRIRRR
jgi:hypothetical protein